ncbi:MAG TPA: cupin domain-containing protein [Pyrinomonadaceae bacterium]|jgi:quercetin dioxygenase-like cupin family protein|nr:cupin domain-containing protein [Pyrinomonadaceae bacterium]
MSILSVSILVFLAASASAQPKIVRKELYKASIGTQPISTVDVREIDFQPKQTTGLHRHPCPVISYVVEGTIRFQIRGEKMRIIHAGQVCYEPAGAIVEHFDNASDHAPAKFIPYYLLNGQKELIEMLPATQTKPQ